MNLKPWIIATILCAFSLGGIAQAQSTTPPGIKTMKMGTMSMLTGASGLTLYVFDADTVPGKSACNGPCAAKWPPLAAPSDAKPVGAYTIVTRDDGSTQWAYKGKPLYFFASDKQPMDTTGDGVAGKWHVASP
jgi:predicted lipoprotein with Yx(FWY)xxD motif